MSSKHDEVHISVDRDGLTGGLQISINHKNGGYRIAGPKYCGKSTNLMRRVLTPRDAEEIKSYLKLVRCPATDGVKP